MSHGTMHSGDLHTFTQHITSSAASLRHY